MSIGTGSYAKLEILAKQGLCKSIFLTVKIYPASRSLYRIEYRLFGTTSVKPDNFQPARILISTIVPQQGFQA